ncbi:uncharacterized protein BDR25DRAFT_318847 [Lindgomyces ingoldianus]|uniref:Uncharacterized protein n=1 Tax=Lindgomyces ingoldianus TaxID=673940 RepID=A0ACB6QD80_9PLEO|nr:uncharacterized protein BDR25DRAFT_318847 [Lindgomyces ingoldianus]KAF2464852.1 hypothetical protein BDR25DRAFT_318847 [Lindgomyces ingoldianus]
MARKIKTQPTSYPKGAFYIARVCQAVASLIVAGEMFYFVYQLKHGGFRVPWMFFFLHAAALYTLITLVVTGLLHWRHRLSALFNGSLNVVACGLWVGGFGMLADAESETILDACTFTYWGNNTGVKICRLYKLLFAASLFGAVSTMSAFVLDVVVYARVHPAAQYSRANPLLEKEDTTYAAGSYEDLYDPHRARSAPGITQPGPSAAQLPVYQPYCKSGKDSNAKGGIGA